MARKNWPLHILFDSTDTIYNSNKFVEINSFVMTNSCQSRIHEIIYSISSNQSIDEIDRVEGHLNDFLSSESTIEGIYHHMVKHRRTGNPTRCLTDAVFNGNLYDRVKISYFSALVQIELSRLMTAANPCGNFTFPNNKAQFDGYLLQITDDVTSASAFLADYIPEKLNMSSSGVESLIISKLIKNYPGGQTDIPHASFYGLGYHIREALKNVGPEQIEKQILVSPSESIDSHFTSFRICEKYWCSAVLAQRGVDVMVTRFLRRQLFYNWSLNKRRERIQPPIVEVLKTDYFIPFSMLVEELERRNISLVAEWARSAAIIRHKTNFAVNCLYPSIPQEYRRERTDLPATSHFRHNNFVDKKYFHDDTCHHFFFFSLKIAFNQAE